MRSRQNYFVIASVLVLVAATAARADVTISSDATENMSCSAGICQPTASDAVLNVGDLKKFLADGNVTVTTTGSGVQANNIDVTANLGWSANALMLDSYQSLSVTASIAVNGSGGLSILTNDGGSGGELAFFGKGHAAFKNLSGRLSINGVNYELVDSISSLASGIRKNPSGDYALASDYDAGKDGKYKSSPIVELFDGTFEGLGNKIIRLRVVHTAALNGNIGLFAQISQVAHVNNIRVIDAQVVIREWPRQYLAVGALVGKNAGTIFRSYASGNISAPGSLNAGGLVGYNAPVGEIDECSTHIDVRVGSGQINTNAGGLVGQNEGTVKESYATGNVETGGRWAKLAGGLIGENFGPVSNSYATGNASGSNGYAGGLIAINNSAKISSSYSIGVPTLRQKEYGVVGGFVGYDSWVLGNSDISDSYWDTTTSGITDPGQGAGIPSNDPGLTGLTTEQLQSGLPAGFDPTVWGENQNINSGLPYLLSNPPAD